MNNKTKKRLTYANIALLFLFSGVEYAVILPTLWLYISEQYHAEEYFLGLVLSAFSLTALLASPIFGRWSDVTKRTKPLLLFANLWSIAGSLMYWMGVSKWFILGARLIAGVGTSVGAPIIADISRTTDTSERTSAIALLFSLRQFGLLLGPGCNLFLSKLDFNIGPFPVNSYTSPGLFMAVLWILLEIFAIFTYYELRDLKNSDKQDLVNNINYQENEAGEISNSVSIKSPLLDSHGGSSSLQYGSIGNRIHLPEPQQGDDANSASGESEYGSVKSGSSDRSFGSVHTDYGSVQTQSSYFGYRSEGEQVSSTASLPTEILTISSGSSSFKTCVSDLETSSEFYRSTALIESAENQIREPGDRSSANQNGEVIPNTVQSEQEESNSSSSSVAGNKLTLKFIYDEYLREEIVVILASVFLSMFSQLSLETIATPMTKSYLNWKEIENSVFYCVAGAEIILVFGVVHFMSKKLQDRTMLVIGLIIEIFALSWMVYIMSFIEFYTPATYTNNLLVFIVGVFLDIFGLPFLAVCSVSLYSKITDPESQGFSQGLRRSVSGTAFILGPLWAGGMLNHLQLLFAINVGLMALVLLLTLLSFKRLNINNFIDKEKSATPPLQEEEDRQPLI